MAEAQLLRNRIPFWKKLFPEDLCIFCASPVALFRGPVGRLFSIPGFRTGFLFCESKDERYAWFKAIVYEVWLV